MAKYDSMNQSVSGKQRYIIYIYIYNIVEVQSHQCGGWYWWFGVTIVLVSCS